MQRLFSVGKTCEMRGKEISEETVTDMNEGNQNGERLLNWRDFKKWMDTWRYGCVDVWVGGWMDGYIAAY